MSNQMKRAKPAARKCPCATFYANPTPANAVELAIGDYRAQNLSTPEHLHLLGVALDMLREAEKWNATTVASLAHYLETD